MSLTHVDVPGGRLQVADDGAGSPIVLLHAGVADLRAWDAMVPPLVAAGYRVVRPDTRGYGAIHDRGRRVLAPSRRHRRTRRAGDRPDGARRQLTGRDDRHRHRDRVPGPSRRGGRGRVRAGRFRWRRYARGDGDQRGVREGRFGRPVRRRRADRVRGGRLARGSGPAGRSGRPVLAGGLHRDGPATQRAWPGQGPADRPRSAGERPAGSSCAARSSRSLARSTSPRSSRPPTGSRLPRPTHGHRSGPTSRTWSGWSSPTGSRPRSSRSSRRSLAGRDRGRGAACGSPIRSGWLTCSGCG